MFDIETQTRIRAFRLNEGVCSLRIMSKGAHLWAAYKPGTIIQWSVKSGGSLDRYNLNEDLETMLVADRNTHIIYNTGSAITVLATGNASLENSDRKFYQAPSETPFQGGVMT